MDVEVKLSKKDRDALLSMVEKTVVDGLEDMLAAILERYTPEAMKDKAMALKFGLSEAKVTKTRKLMDVLPDWSQYVYGTSTDIEGFRAFLKWEKTLEGQKAIEKVEKMLKIA